MVGPISLLTEFRPRGTLARFLGDFSESDSRAGRTPRPTTNAPPDDAWGGPGGAAGAAPPVRFSYFRTRKRRAEAWIQAWAETQFQWKYDRVSCDFFIHPLGSPSGPKGVLSSLEVWFWFRAPAGSPDISVWFPRHRGSFTLGG